MAVTLAYKILLLVVLPAFNLGLLSDYKICGDSECESKSQTSDNQGWGAGRGVSLYFIHLILMFKLYVIFVAIFHFDNVCIYDLKAFYI